jgi:hypothetical protein
VLSAGVGLLAQAPAPADGPQQENPAKLQAFRFESMLRNAIEIAGQRLAQQARKIAPDLTLHVSEPAVARGLKLAGYGFVFDVQAPNISSSMLVWDMQLQRSRPQVSGPVTPIRGSVDGLPAAAPAPIVNFDPDQAYTAYVKDALIDSILDESSMLVLGPGEFLTVAVSGIDQPTPNQLYRTNSAKMILTIRAADLIEFRQGRLTRDQAKEKLAQERF